MTDGSENTMVDKAEFVIKRSKFTVKHWVMNIISDLKTGSCKFPDIYQIIKAVTFKCITVMIRFSAQSTYLLLAPQQRALIRDRVLI